LVLHWAAVSIVGGVALWLRFEALVITRKPDFFTQCEIFHTDPALRSLALLFVCPISACMIVPCLVLSVGDISLEAYIVALDRIERHSLCLLFSFGFANMTENVCAYFGTFVLLSIYVAAWIQGGLTDLLTHTTKFSARQHQNRFFGQIMILLLVIYGMLLSYRTLDAVALYQVLGSLMTSGLTIVLDIVGHVVFLLDPDELGNSVGSYRAFFVSEAIVSVLQISVSLFFIGCLLIESELPIFPMYQLYEIVNDFYNQYMMLRRWVRMRCVIEHLPTSTESDAMRDDTCVICRQEMRIGCGRKLPCGHSFHVECIERWITLQLRCPICKRNLKRALEAAERNLGGETQKRPGGSADRNIFRFDDFMS
jgi:hypothetical protein